MMDKLVEILAEPVTCEDGKSHYIDENNRRCLASIIREEIKKELEGIKTGGQKSGFVHIKSKDWRNYWNRAVEDK